MPLKPLVILLLLCCTFRCAATADSLTRHQLSFRFLGQHLFSAHYDYAIWNTKHVSVLAGLGIGRAEYSDDSQQPPTPPVRTVYPGISLQTRRRYVNAYCSLNSFTYFYGKFSFTDVNGFFGMRIIPGRKAEPVFLLLGYTPKLYTTLTTAEYFYTPFKLGFGGGVRF